MTTYKKAHITSEPFGQKDDRLYLTAKQRNELGFDVGDTVSIKHGVRKKDVTVVNAKRERVSERNVVRMSDNTQEDLGLEAVVELNYKKTRNGLQLGPVIGILSRCQNMRDREFFGQTGKFKKLMKKAKERGTEMYVFSPTTIDYDKKTVVGIFYEGNQFVTRIVPLPDVIYDRGFFRDAREYIPASVARNSLKTKRLNPEKVVSTVGDKYKFSQAMKQAGVNHPDTKKDSDSNRRSMAQKYKTLFFKPSKGSKGDGIITATKKANRFTLSYKVENDGEWEKKTVRNVSAGQLENKLKSIKRKLKTHNHEYIVQQGLDLYEHDDGQTDIRVICQRDGKGKYRRTGLVARVGGNVSQDGETGSFSEVTDTLALDAGIEASDVRNNVRDIAGKTYKAIEKYAGKKTGEIGVDVVLDKQGKAWVVEANSKPRKSFQLPSQKQHRNCQRKCSGKSREIP